ncbi:MAG: winged helix-turn-helix transcriptional regulator [Lachnospiraceae bacterium]|nr:winged helix-turn-helix transcriptional regulator [Lachnospiraceae bacterium]
MNFKASQDGALNGTLNDTLGEEDVKLISLLRTEPSVTQVLAAEKLGFSKRKVQRMMKSLSERGYIEREGSRKNGRWVILKDV